MLHSVYKRFTDYDGDKMVVWRIVNYDGTEPEIPLYIWRREQSAKESSSEQKIELRPGLNVH